MQEAIVKIDISGPVGSGKTQLAHAIGSLLRNNGVPVRLHDDGGMQTIENRHLELPTSTVVNVIVKESL